MSKPNDAKVTIHFDAAAMRNITLNSNLQSIDEALKKHVKEPEDQMAILMMAQVLAFARIRRKHNITGKRRKLILNKALEEFEAKIRKYGFEDTALAAVEVQPKESNMDSKTPPTKEPVPFPTTANGKLDVDATNRANCPDVDHGGREEDDQDNDEGA